MKMLPFTRRAKYRRRVHYIDETLQRIFIVGLVLLEGALAAGLAWLTSRRLDQIIDDNLYRVHLADTGPMLPQLMQEALTLLGVFFVVNLVALLLVDLIWRHYVNSILRNFMQLMEKTAALDFRIDPRISQRHQILDLTESQRDQDRQRLTEFRSALSALPAALGVPDNARSVADLLQALQQLLPLPPASTTTPGQPGNRRASDSF